MNRSADPAEPSPTTPKAAASAAAGAGPRVVDVATLLDGRPEVRLLHRGQEYRLRVTRQGKLILTK